MKFAERLRPAQQIPEIMTMCFTTGLEDLSKPAMICENREVVFYEQLQTDCRNLMARMTERRLVLILTDAAAETLRLYYAALNGGQTVFLLDHSMCREFVQKYIEDYHPHYIWCSADRGGEFSGSCVFQSAEHVLLRTVYDSYPIFPDLAVLLTTSGSTGSPKTVRLSHTNICRNADAVIDALEITAAARGALTIPMSHAYGMGVVNSHFRAGATLLLANRKIYDPIYLEFLRREGVTNLHGVPIQHMMLERIGFYERLPETVDLITTGGGRMDDRLQNMLNHLTVKRQIRFRALYGQTEGTSMMTKMHPEDAVNAPACIGIPCRGMEAALDHGELVFHGDGVCLGYAQSWQSLNSGDENHGVLHTGDLARIDGKGRIYLCGRIRRFIKLYGVRIGLEGVERLVCTRFPQVECACAGTDSRLNVWIAGEENTDAVRRFLADRLGVSHLLIQVDTLGELPRTASGKTDYRELEKNYCIGQPLRECGR